jgi:lipopolysaccharide/colanic/teichoic acid biosynthesis glycosyltransferase
MSISARRQPDVSSPDVAGEALFSQLLVRERKRSERSNRPFILLTVRARTGRDLASSPGGAATLETLAAATRGTDVVGWMDHPTVAGVIFAEIGAAAPGDALHTVRSRVCRELQQRLGATLYAGLSLEFRIYPEPGDGTGSKILRPIDPLFHPDLEAEDRKRRLADGIKRAVDIVASVTLLLVLAPVLVAAAVAVKLSSPGPILFRQVRVGRMCRPFTMLKFRTMYVGVAEAPHHEFVTRFIRESSRIQSAAKNQVFKLTSDARITPAGHILRRSSIDELPQLWNVLVGEMSLVGPRPPLPYELEQYAPWHRRRILDAKPGVTGLWQVIGRSRTTFDEMVRLDLRYARTRSLWTDFRILVRTPAAVVRGKGAH